MTTTADSIYTSLLGSYPDAGATLGDLLYAYWSENGLENRGTLQYEFFINQGGTGGTLGDLIANFFAEVYDVVVFDTHDFDEFLELVVFGRYDTVEQEVIMSSF